MKGRRSLGNFAINDLYSQAFSLSLEGTHNIYFTHLDYKGGSVEPYSKANKRRKENPGHRPEVVG